MHPALVDNIVRFTYRSIFHISGREFLKGSPHSSSIWREKLVECIPRATEPILLAVVGIVFMKPTNSNFVYSVFPFQNFGAMIIFCCLEALPILEIYFAANFVFTFIICYIISTRYWLQTLLSLK
jgi:hypothetical protein